MRAGLLFFLLVLIADFLAVVFAPSCPPIPSMMYARVLIYPVILVYGALALPFPAALALAFFNGLLWDALTATIVNPSPFSGGAVTVVIPVGWSIVLYGALAVLVQGLRPLFLRGRWDVYCLASGFCTVVILLAEYSMLTYRLGRLVFPKELWARILLPGFFAMLLAVLVYPLFYFIAHLLGYEVRVPNDRDRDRDSRLRAL